MKKIILMMIMMVSALGMSAGEKPSFPGGDAALANYISENMIYPENAKELGIEGVVTVTFMVKSDGSIGNIKINRSVDPDLESEAIRLVKRMPNWVPADKGGSPVDEPAEVDINFSLE